MGMGMAVLFLRQQGPGSQERIFEGGADIFRSEAFYKIGALHHEEGLRVRAAEDEVFSFALEFLIEIFESVEAGGIHGEDLTHAEDEDFGFLAGAFEAGFEFVRGTEGERTEEAEDLNFGRDIGHGKFFGFGFREFLFAGDLGGFGNAPDQKHGGEHHADADRDGEVHQDGEGECS